MHAYKVESFIHIQPMSEVIDHHRHVVVDVEPCSTPHNTEHRKFWIFESLFLVTINIICFTKLFTDLTSISDIFTGLHKRQ